MRRAWICPLAVVMACNARPIDRKRLYATILDLAAVAAEARLLLTQDRGLPARYRDGHRRDLAQRARDAATELDPRAEDPALEPVRQTASVLGRGLAGSVEATRDPALLERSSHELTALAARVAP
jgi:hypothetical protein